VNNSNWKCEAFLLVNKFEPIAESLHFSALDQIPEKNTGTSSPC
jgi:hypothetical protein